MKEYREKIRVQLVVMYFCAAALLIFGIWAFGAEFWGLPFPVPKGNEHWISGWRGFVSGVSSGILLVMLVGIFRIRQALKNEEKLKKLYVKEHDERKETVCRMAGSAALRSALLLGIVAVVIAGYFSFTVCLTVLICLLILSFLSVGFRIYYERKL